MSDDGDSKEVQRAEDAGAEKAAEQGAEQGAGKDERVEEARRIRRLQIMMSLVMSVISQDPDLTLEEAAEMAANARRAALAMFPDKELAYDILYRPRLQRLMNERFRLQ
jgi:divalent metal cation (Fe/Co/Zn/Cd) transporter